MQHKMFYRILYHIFKRWYPDQLQPERRDEMQKEEFFELKEMIALREGCQKWVLPHVNGGICE